MTFPPDPPSPRSGHLLHPKTAVSQAVLSSSTLLSLSATLSSLTLDMRDLTAVKSKSATHSRKQVNKEGHAGQRDTQPWLANAAFAKTAGLVLEPAGMASLGILSARFPKQVGQGCRYYRLLRAKQLKKNIYICLLMESSRVREVYSAFSNSDTRHGYPLLKTPAAPVKSMEN